MTEVTVENKQELTTTYTYKYKYGKKEYNVTITKNTPSNKALRDLVSVILKM